MTQLGVLPFATLLGLLEQSAHCTQHKGKEHNGTYDSTHAAQQRYFWKKSPVQPMYRPCTSILLSNATVSLLVAPLSLSAVPSTGNT